MVFLLEQEDAFAALNAAKMIEKMDEQDQRRS